MGRIADQGQTGIDITFGILQTERITPTRRIALDPAPVIARPCHDLGVEGRIVQGQ